MPLTVELQSILQSLELTSDLNDAARSSLADVCKVDEVAKGQRLLAARGGDRLVLIDGSAVRIAGGSGHRLQTCQGLSDPLDVFDETPGQGDFLVTETPCVFLRIPRDALDQALSGSLEVDDIELDPTEGDFLAELYELISTKKLELPARPEVALRIQELTANPDAGVDDLTEVIQRDGTIAGALVHATNSPVFRASKKIQTVRDAVLRLGFQNTRILTTNLALRRAFRARNEVTRQAMQAVWADGVLCSAHAYLLSDTLGMLNRERALLAGLISGIGAVPIIQFVEMRDPTPRRDQVDMLVEKLRSITGVLVVNYWGLGEDLVAVAEHASNWGYRAAEPDYASIVVVGRWAALQSEQRPHPSAAEVPSFETLGLTQPAPDDGVAELADRGETLEMLKHMFDA